MRKNDERDPDLQRFLDEIKNVEKGVTTARFSDVLELRNNMKLALSNLLSREFIELREIQKIPTRIKQTEGEKSMLELLQQSVVHPVQLGEIRIVNVDLPIRIQRKQAGRIRAEIKGSTNHGFLDLAIFDSEGNNYWRPDPRSWNTTTDRGQLSLVNGAYSSEWEFIIPNTIKTGKCKAFVGAYEDTIDLPTWNRRLTGYIVKDIEVYE